MRSTTSSGVALCRALSDATDVWLADLLDDATRGDNSNLALVAVGGYGRRELAPSSDLDVLLLHAGRKDIGGIAQRLWYPIWDSNTKLGHAVRSMNEALKLASNDLDTATSFLQVRHISGDVKLTNELHDKASGQWRKRGKAWLGRLATATELRHEADDDVAFLLEPNLKDGRGGLRDVHAMRWAQLTELAPAGAEKGTVDTAYEVLLSARVELHRLTGRAGDVMALQEQDGVANALGYRHADALMAAISSSARTIAWVSDGFWRKVRHQLSGVSHSPEMPVSSGIFVRDDEVYLADSARPFSDPTLLLRVAVAAAHHGFPIAMTTLDRLASETEPFPDPWPVGAVDCLVALLLEGRSALDVLESLDQRDLITRVLPEWSPVRSKPQRNAYHRFTVDRHLWETAANSAAFAGRVSRPDLLVIGCLLHDLGKGYRGDHTEVGITLVERIGCRMGFAPDDVEVLAQMVRHHLLLPDVATRRDLADEETISSVALAAGSPLVLELLAALTEADSVATSTAAWSAWKAELVADLVARTAHVLDGGEVHEVAWSLFPSPEVQALMGAQQTSISYVDDRVTVVAPDRPGLFSRVSGVLSLHGLDVVGAQAHSDEQGMAASEFRVVVGKGANVTWERVRRDLELVLLGRLALNARLEERAKNYSRRKRTSARDAVPHVRVHNNASSNATVLEVRAPDSVGILYRITRTMADMGLDIRHAKVSTLGHEVVDSFYVRDSAGAKVIDPSYLVEIERALLHVLK